MAKLGTLGDVVGNREALQRLKPPPPLIKLPPIAHVTIETPRARQFDAHTKSRRFLLTEIVMRWHSIGSPAVAAPWTLDKADLLAAKMLRCAERALAHHKWERGGTHNIHALALSAMGFYR